ncbi:conserved hypothetical protein [Rippkaea orientalis PCC 8801]|uniref:Uncharacterized protein n=1 Tax=Rippkaea orientalis (strain PCC 8801 / RF-1) TaxID=41431 RepID=B7K4L4_RIPO1|nr:hypothetical protein [Rippkaea orientalis]ACK65479.1 conserved hypothetical protein [Rippkaea orientalis PCC 8801]
MATYSWYFSFSAGFGFLILLAFFILQWLHIPAGNLVDWVIGIASFWWLIIIVTVPWNVYFDAKEVIVEAATSEEKGIEVDTKQINYVKKVCQGALIVAIALHLLSAIGLYELAVMGISSVGYISAMATLLLTVLRPTIRGYQYLAYRLSSIRGEIKYPRQDILELRDRVNQLERTLQSVENKLDVDQPDSWISVQQNKWQTTHQEVNHLNALLERFQSKNTLEHEQILREASNAISQLTEDSQFLNQVREIIRFFKTA